MRTSLITALALIFIMAAPGATAADRLIPFSALLTDEFDVPLNGVYKITFNLYSVPTGGTVLWTEEQATASVIEGQLSVLLGSGATLNNPPGVNFTNPLFLGLSIDDAPEMIPRHQLVPAYHAVSTDTVIADAIGSAEVANETLTASDLAPNSVGSSEIATDAVGSSEIAANAVGSSEIAANAVGGSEIAANAVGSSEIAPGAQLSGSTGVNGAFGNVTFRINTEADDFYSLYIDDPTIGLIFAAGPTTTVGSEGFATFYTPVGFQKSVNFGDPVTFSDTTNINGSVNINGTISGNIGVNQKYSNVTTMIQTDTADDISLRVEDLNNEVKFQVWESGLTEINREGGERVLTLGSRFSTSGSGFTQWGINIDTSDPGDPDLMFGYNGVNRGWVEPGGGFNAPSDRRLKTDIDPLRGALSTALKLEPKTYRLKDQPIGAEKRMGFIAQDVQDVAPSLVSEASDTLGLAYGKFGVIAIGAIQEFHQAYRATDAQKDAEIAELQERLRSLTERLEQLEARTH